MEKQEEKKTTEQDYHDEQELQREGEGHLDNTPDNEKLEEDEAKTGAGNKTKPAPTKTVARFQKRRTSLGFAYVSFF